MTELILLAPPYREKVEEPFGRDDVVAALGQLKLPASPLANPRTLRIQFGKLGQKQATCDFAAAVGIEAQSDFKRPSMALLRCSASSLLARVLPSAKTSCVRDICNMMRARTGNRAFFALSRRHRYGQGLRPCKWRVREAGAKSWLGLSPESG